MANRLITSRAAIAFSSRMVTVDPVSLVSTIRLPVTSSMSSSAGSRAAPGRSESFVPAPASGRDGW